MKKYKPSGPSLGVGKPTVKNLLIFLSIIIFSFSMISFANADRYKGNKKGDRDRYQERNYGDRHRSDRQYRYDRGHRRDRGHHYGHYKRPPRGRYYHSPRYRGHWRSWRSWERHRQRYPKRYRSGRYHHDRQGYMMFSFCESEGVCFSFSIGK